MKKYFLNLVAFTAITAVSAVLFSCGNDDEDDITNGIDDGNGQTSYLQIPATTAEATALVNAIYRPLQTLSSSYTFLLESATETTISFEEADDTRDGPQVSIFETVPSNWYPIKVFNRLYQSISATNLAIESIAASELDDNVKKPNIARARFIRGYNYFQLVQLFGEVPLILSVTPTDEERTTRRSIEDVYNQIVKDLTEDIGHLPEFATQKSNPTQLAAKTILSKVYLTWGQKPLTQSEVEAIKTSRTDPAKPPVDDAKLQEALKLANEVIASDRYSLLDNFNEIWGVINENNSEVIFSIQHHGDGVDAQGNHQTHCGFTWPKQAERDPHLSFADIYYEEFLSPHDSRRLYSFVTEVSYRDVHIDVLTWPISIVRSGKWIHRSEENTNIAVENQPNSIDHIDFRLAEVYLIKAEAAFFLDLPGVALEAVNTIRARAGVEALATLTAQDLYNEWEYELSQEQKHWLNLVRWRTYIATVLTKVEQFEYYKDAYGNIDQFKQLPDAIESRFPFYNRIHKHLRGKYNNIEGRFYRFPIPLSEQRTDLGITPQNPGYSEP